jgi:hypothetical protein
MIDDVVLFVGASWGEKAKSKAKSVIFTFLYF